jgi:glycine/D-amino acid oxidase-like deaminating enzyme
MTAQIWAQVLVAVLLVGMVSVWLSWTAGRLDRLHIRLATAHAALDRHLVDRAACTTALAVSGVLDPAASLLLLDAAQQLRANDRDRSAQEGALSQTLRTVLTRTEVEEWWRSSDEGGRALLTDLAAACDRVRLAAAFHTDLVARTSVQRRRPLVRWLHLAGRAPWPQPERIDVEPPEPLLAYVFRSESTAPRRT